jgi:hypothetical protein
VSCWGGNSNGQIGTGLSGVWEPPTLVSGVSNVSKLASGGLHSCAVLNDGMVRCWGANYGRLGSGSRTPISGAVEVLKLKTATTVDVGIRHTCATEFSGKVMCWGENPNGEIGDGSSNTIRYTPVYSQTPRRVGNVLELDSGAWNEFPIGVSRYQWYRCSEPVVSPLSNLPSSCNPISRANSRSYTLVQADLGFFVTAATNRSNRYGSAFVISEAAVVTTD